MHRLRLLLAARPLAALVLVLFVLAVRMLVPAGFMPVATDSGVVLGLCPGSVPAMAGDHGPMAGMHHGGDRREAPPAGTAAPCAFAGVGVAAAELPVLASASLSPSIAVERLPRLVRKPVQVAATRWRPPLRAPPLG